MDAAGRDLGSFGEPIVMTGLSIAPEETQGVPGAIQAKSIGSWKVVSSDYREAREGVAFLSAPLTDAETLCYFAQRKFTPAIRERLERLGYDLTADYSIFNANTQLTVCQVRGDVNELPRCPVKMNYSDGRVTSCAAGPEGHDGDHYYPFIVDCSESWNGAQF
jgi:hypothetical protein